MDALRLVDDEDGSPPAARLTPAQRSCLLAYARAGSA